MTGYPIVLTNLEEQRCLVIGGGTVAARKVEMLVAAGARPAVISPDLCAGLEQAVTVGQAEAIRRRYRPGDLAGAALAIAATGDRDVNAAVAAEARERGIPVNVVDDPELCTFIAPAVIRRGDLTVAISTGGASPALSRTLRQVLETVIDPAYGDLVALLAELRPRILQAPRAQQPALWDRLLDGELLACLRASGPRAARQRAEQIVGSTTLRTVDSRGNVQPR